MLTCRNISSISGSFYQSRESILSLYAQKNRRESTADSIDKKEKPKRNGDIDELLDK